MKKKFTFLMAALMLLTIIGLPGKAVGQEKTTTYKLEQVTSVTTGELYVFEQGGHVMNNSVSSSALQTTTSYNTTGLAGTETYIWELESATGGYYMKNKNKASNKYLNNSSSSSVSFGSSSSVWKFTFTDGIALIQNTSNSNRFLGYTTASSYAYKAYATQNLDSYPHEVKVYKLVEESSGPVLTITNPTGGTISVTNGGTPVSSGANIASGTTLTLDKTIDAGYTFSEWKVFKTDYENTTINVDNNNQFAMPDYNVTVTAIVNANPSHTITLNAATNGTISTSPSGSALEGQTVTITATPAEGYDFTSFTVTKASSEAVAVSTVGNVGTFTMPASNVTVSATFTAKTTYEITKTVTPANSGTITADANAWAGKTVNVSVSPAAGYIYSSIAIKKTGDASTTITPGGNATDGFTFTMPAYAVTITATFSTADIYALYSGDLVEGDYVIYYNGYAMKNTVSSNRLTYSTVTPASNQIVNPNGEIVWHIAPSGDYWTIYNESVNKYAASTGAASKAQLLTSGSDDMSLWTANGTSTYEFVNKKNTSNGVNANLRNNGTYGFACYATGTGGALSLYRKAVNSTMAVASAVANGTITATPAGGSAIAEGGSITVSSGTTVTLSASGEGSYVLNAWDVYKTGEPSTKVTVTSNTFTMPDYGVTVNASFRLPTTFTVWYSVNGSIVDGLTQSSIPEGNSVTLPTSGDVTTVPSGYAFAGWTENAATGELISGSTYTPTASTTLYLVFIKSGETLGYNKVTSLENITEGTYIIVNDNYCLPSVSTGSSTAPEKSNDYKVTNASSTSTYTSVPANTEWIFTGSNTAMTIKNSNGDYLYEINDNNGVRVNTTPDTWAFELNTSAPCYAMKGANNKRYCATYTSDWRSYTTKNYTNYNDGGRLYLYKKTPVYTLVKTISGSESMTNIEKTYIITVANDGVLTLSGTNNASAAHLIIEDGGKLKTNSTGVKATFRKSIVKTTETAGVADNAHWYAISSPVSTVASGLEISSIENFVDSDDDDFKYNLFRYNESAAAQWEAYNEEAHDDFVTLENGRGYLYRNNTDDGIEFVGTVNTDDVEITLTASAEGKLKGFNLIGNPFAEDITMSNITGKSFSGGYILSNGSAWNPSIQTTISPCQGFLVQVDAEETITIKKPVSAKGNTYNQEYLQFIVANSEYEDMAYALFDKGYGLNKINHRNADVPMIFIPQNGQDYAIAIMSDNTKSFNLNFKAMTTGKYTLSYKATGEYNYLHVIDRLTGADVDMLLEGEYSFIATPNDNENRFIVRLEYMPNYGESNDEIFAFQNGNEILVSGEGELQIFDVTGRSVMTTTISGAESINLSAQGVYIFRLIGSEIKTQKIVVR